MPPKALPEVSEPSVFHFHWREVVEAVHRMLNDAKLEDDSQLTLIRRGHEIVISSPSLQVTDEKRGTDVKGLSFEASLAEVMARRDSALKRLAE